MKIVTHNGRFHADDTFAIATLLLIYPEGEVCRTRDPEVITNADIVVDVGFINDRELRRFDHHQPGGAGVRENGIPYASFGLVWKEFGRDLASEEAVQMIDDKLVAPIDSHDNGVDLVKSKFPPLREYTISDFFYSYLSLSDRDESNLFKVFMDNVQIAQDLLKREIQIAEKEVAGYKKVREILSSVSDKRIVILEEDLPWLPVFIPEPEVLYVIYPRKEGTWGAKAVPKKFNDFELKKPFPNEWGGKNDEELARVTGVPDAVFCHNKLFVCSAKTKEGALALAEKALNA